MLVRRMFLITPQLASFPSDGAAGFRVAPLCRFPETGSLAPRDPAEMLLVFLLKGIAVGLVIAVPVGPVGVMCVRRTIFQGKLAGFVSGLGAATADAIFGFIAAFGLTFVSDWLIGYQQWLRIAGGFYLFYVGGTALLARPEDNLQSKPDAESLFRDYLSTFALTLTNPITIIAFLGIFSAVGLTGEDATLGRAAILVLGVWLGSLLWWLALTFGLGLLFRSFGPRHLAWINRASGMILLISGAALLAVPLLKHWS
jgi:threonine/homoserine/homoserine lactone efflux protein